MNSLITKNIAYKGIMFTILLTKANNTKELYISIIHNNISIAIGYSTKDVIKAIPVYFLAEERDISAIVSFCEDIRTIELDYYTLIVSYGGVINDINSKKYEHYNASMVNEFIASSSNAVVKSPAYSSLNKTLGLSI